MKEAKIKTHVLWISPKFPHDHPRKGEPTYFVERIQLALNLLVQMPGDLLIDLEPKLHTCRADSKNSKKKKGAYEEWKRKIDEVNRGEAILSVRMWSGSAYNRLHDGSKPVEIAQFDKDSGCGVQKLEFYEDKDEIPSIKYPIINNFSEPKIEDIAENDGLSLHDFKAWFRKADLSKPVAIIQFTKFRY
jgi:hypothetical protein